MRIVPSEALERNSGKYLRMAETDEIVITRHGRTAGILVGFASKDVCFEYRPEHDTRFLKRIEQARESGERGKGIRIENLAE